MSLDECDDAIKHFHGHKMEDNTLGVKPLVRRDAALAAAPALASD
jgi:hypothetical protein